MTEVLVISGVDFPNPVPTLVNKVRFVVEQTIRLQVISFTINSIKLVVTQIANWHYVMQLHDYKVL